MVRRIISSLKNETGTIHDAAYILGFFALLSQILGLFRDRMLAHYFGAGELLDMYYAAFRIPDLIFATVASLVSSSVLIPFLQEKMLKGREGAKKFIDEMWTAFFVLILLVSLIVFALMPFFTDLLYGSFSPDMKDGIVSLSRILLLSPIFLGLSNFLSSIVQAERRFTIYALSPVLYNFAIIVGLIILFPIFGIQGVVLGVVLGSFLHALIQVPFARSVGLLPDIVFPLRLGSIRKVSVLSLPRTLALASVSISLVLIVSFASEMAAGSIAVLMLAYNLQGSPMTIVGVSYSTAAFPTLTKLIAEGQREKFLKQVANSLRHIILLSLLAAALFIVLRAHIVRTVLGTGAFSWNDTRLTAAVVALFAVSAFSQGSNLLFVRAYYALGKTKLPLIISFVSSALSVLLSLLFIYLFKTSEFLRDFFAFTFKLEGVPGLEVLTLPLGFSIGSILGTIMFFVAFEKSFKGLFALVKKSIWESVFGALVAGAVTYLALTLFGATGTPNTLLGIFSQGLVSGMIGLIAAIGALLLLQNTEAKEIVRNIRKRFERKPPTLPEALPFDSL